VFETAHVIPAPDGTHSIDFATLIPIEGEQTWEAMYAAWGCRSLGWDYRVVSDVSDVFEFTFEVKGTNASAKPILAEIARRYPSLVAAFRMVSDSEGFAATGVIAGGELTFAEYPWSEAFFALVEGHPYGEWPEEAA
jgi:hypothetical protein